MSLVEGVEEIIIKFRDGTQKVLRANSVCRVPTRTEGEPMSEQGSITYWHIVAGEK